MAIVVFDPAEFKAQFPQFSGVSDVQLEFYFGEAELYLSNKSCSVVQDVNRRKRLLYLLTAHIATLFGALQGNSSVQPVGRLGSATEGSVSVGYEYNAPFTYSWFIQTPYGAAFLQATSSERGFRYYSAGQRACAHR